MEFGEYYCIIGNVTAIAVMGINNPCSCSKEHKNPNPIFWGWMVLNMLNMHAITTVVVNVQPHLFLTDGFFIRKKKGVRLWNW